MESKNLGATFFPGSLHGETHEDAFFLEPALVSEAGRVCTLAPGLYGFLLQAVLGMISLSVVYVKYVYIEKQRRAQRVFFLDIAKQACGALCMHLLNIISAAVLFRYFSVQGDTCDWYFLNIFFDTTLGLAINFLLLKMSSSLFNYSPGLYEKGDPPHDTREISFLTESSTGETGISRYSALRWDIFVKQTIIWLFILFTMKSIIVIILCLGHATFVRITENLFRAFDQHPDAKLGIVMIVIPCSLNAMQYCITDQFLQYRSHKQNSFHQIIGRL